MDRWMDGRTDGRMNEWMNESMNESDMQLLSAGQALQECVRGNCKSSLLHFASQCTAQQVPVPSMYLLAVVIHHRKAFHGHHDMLSQCDSIRSESKISKTVAATRLWLQAVRATATYTNSNPMQQAPQLNCFKRAAHSAQSCRQVRMGPNLQSNLHCTLGHSQTT